MWRIRRLARRPGVCGQSMLVGCWTAALRSCLRFEQSPVARTWGAVNETVAVVLANSSAMFRGQRTAMMMGMWSVAMQAGFAQRVGIGGGWQSVGW